MDTLYPRNNDSERGRKSWHNQRHQEILRFAIDDGRSSSFRIPALDRVWTNYAVIFHVQRGGCNQKFDLRTGQFLRRDPVVQSQLVTAAAAQEGRNESNHTGPSRSLNSFQRDWMEMRQEFHMPCLRWVVNIICVRFIFVVHRSSFIIHCSSFIIHHSSRTASEQIDTLTD
jgi:hypothetical protein